ncbi:MAG: 30S ribosomal protein S3ae [Nitrososphaeraceae archaeon]|nr:30S ribosomal protein S3ae [Nitrososphaeraceae archaeon]MDW0180321.1 30S ribosomal protein S3ae [Nitrososphaeraceae archaeon]MDW0192233.1 30S ribosomal protein S3ae [Nitrososphaeraceae archaeon]MDW0212002.1 30S ribosomal protein S3ae [Nitrososphaeraceae archaeon]MDW0218633.1 30S ribosomal protein S3ae [Nitrososphaeraceae archaeon]
MAKGARRGGRVRDKWRDKQWLILDSPSSFGDFGGHHINYLPITDANTAVGRVVENTLYDIKKQDQADHKTKVFVEIEKVSEGVATTIFKGHEYGKEFLRSLVRRGSSMITHIHNYNTNDGHEFRVEVVTFSQRRINSSKKHELRRVIHELLSEKVPQWDLNNFIKQVTDDNSEFHRELLEKGRKIASLRHIGIKKTKLVSSNKSSIQMVNTQTEDTQTEDERVNTQTEDTQTEDTQTEDERVNTQTEDTQTEDERVNTQTEDEGTETPPVDTEQNTDST